MSKLVYEMRGPAKSDRLGPFLLNIL
jgi:hypothetical protein